MQFIGIDHIEFYVSDLESAADEFRGRYGFSVTAGSGRSVTDRRSLLLTQGGARLVLTAGTGRAGEVDAFVDAHGEGVRTVALRVRDAAGAFSAAIEAGAVQLRPPLAEGGAISAVVAGVESIAHAFVQRHAGQALLPGFHAIDGVAPEPEPGTELIRGFDHLAICLPRGSLAAAEEFYGRTLGLQRTFTEYIQLGDQAMDSVVVEDGNGQVTLTLVAPDCEEGQLVDYLEAYGAGGVQHVAFLTDRIAEAVPELTARGVQFLPTPAPYYASLPERLGYAKADTRVLAESGILADRDRWGDLLQIFTRSPFPRRTVFFELIERRGARTFGSANIRALYEAAELERTTHRPSPAGGRGHGHRQVASARERTASR